MTIDTAYKMNVVESYVAGYANGDLEQILGIFAADAIVEDPAGTPAHQGRAALITFFGVGIKMGAKLRLLGDIRCAGDSAAFVFAVDLTISGKAQCIEVIDVFRFDDEGKIIEMRAYWGPENMKDL